jgi:hypothetical protein
MRVSQCEKDKVIKKVREEECCLLFVVVVVVVEANDGKNC